MAASGILNGCISDLLAQPGVTDLPDTVVNASSVNNFKYLIDSYLYDSILYK